MPVVVRYVTGNNVYQLESNPRRAVLILSLICSIVLLLRHIHASVYCSVAFSIVIWFFHAKHTLFTLDLYSNTRPAFGLHISPNT